DAPGMEVIPIRLERVLPVGEGASHYGWTVSPETVARELPGVPIWRPEFEEGDVLLFDHLTLHRTAADEGMPNVRYAIGGWSFAPSVYPGELSAPLVVGGPAPGGGLCAIRRGTREESAPELTKQPVRVVGSHGQPHRPP